MNLPAQRMSLLATAILLSSLPSEFSCAQSSQDAEGELAYERPASHHAAEKASLARPDLLVLTGFLAAAVGLNYIGWADDDTVVYQRASGRWIAEGFNRLARSQRSELRRLVEAAPIQMRLPGAFFRGLVSRAVMEEFEPYEPVPAELYREWVYHNGKRLICSWAALDPELTDDNREHWVCWYAKNDGVRADACTLGSTQSFEIVERTYNCLCVARAGGTRFEC